MTNVHPHPEWKILLGEFGKADFGLMIPHQSLEGLLGFGRGDKRYYATITTWKKHMLEDCGREIETIWNEGYRLVLPDEFRKRSHRRLKKARRETKVAGTIVEVAPLEKMSKEEAQKIMEYGSLLKTVGHFMMEISKKAIAIERKPEKPELEAGDFKAVAD